MARHCLRSTRWASHVWEGGHHANGVLGKWHLWLLPPRPQYPNMPLAKADPGALHDSSVRHCHWLGVADWAAPALHCCSSLRGSCTRGGR